MFKISSFLVALAASACLIFQAAFAEWTCPKQTTKNCDCLAWPGEPTNACYKPAQQLNQEACTGGLARTPAFPGKWGCQDSDDPEANTQCATSQCGIAICYQEANCMWTLYLGQYVCLADETDWSSVAMAPMEEYPC